MININKLFPRFSITSKLVIAFVLLAVVPVGSVGFLAARYAARQAADFYRRAIEYDLEIVHHETELALEHAENDVELAASLWLVDPLTGGAPEGVENESLARFVGQRDALYRLKTIDPSGREVVVAQRNREVEFYPESGNSLLYALEARRLAEHERVALPVELLVHSDDEDLQTISAVAVVVPIYVGHELTGAVVGEFFAEEIFAGIRLDAPVVDAVTGMVGADGLLLFHSEIKTGWRSLYEGDIRADLPADVTDSILTGSSGTMLTGDGRLVTFGPLHVQSVGLRPVMLYRSVALTSIGATLRAASLPLGLLAVVALSVVLLLAVLAARQFTHPIFALQRQAHRLATGEPPEPLNVETNDEIEDLANDFAVMAESLSQYQQHLEHSVAERTHELEETYAQLHSIWQHSADAIIGLDADWRVQSW
ncbi:MAG: HAMP domain-containing protein, partial [Gemmatimonadales bacterium]